MRRTFKLRAAVLTLALLLLLGGAAGAVFADGGADDAASVGWVVSAKDGEDNDLTLTSAEAVESALGRGFSVNYGKDAAGAPITAPTVADLRRGGVTITPPAGYAVDTLFLVAEGASPAEGSRSLLALAQPALDGSNAFTLPAAIFAEDFDASAVGRVFNGSAETYSFQIALKPLSAPEQITLSYSAGSLAASLGETALVPGGNSAVFPVAEGKTAASGTIAALESSVADYALRTLAKRFTGWKLTLPNGASVLLAGGESFTLPCSASLEAQWEDVIVFAFTGGEKMYDGTALIGSYSQIGSVREGDVLSVPEEALTLSRTDAGESPATLDLSLVSVTRDGADVTGEYAFEVLPATLRVVKRGVTFTVTDVSCEYDGTAHAPSAFTLSSGELAAGHSAAASYYYGQQTVPGKSTGAASFTISDADGNDVTANYEVSVINGSITVTVRSEKQPVTVSIADTEKEYDGTADVTAQYSLSSGSLLGSDRLVAGEFSGSVTDAGTGSVNGSFTVFNGDTDVSENYAITVVPGALTVKPRPITLTADSAEKTYDGTALSKDSFTLTSGSLVAGHSVSATVSGSQTEIGSSANVIDKSSVAISDGSDGDVTANYKVSLINGTLTVKRSTQKQPLTVTLKDKEKEYDGSAELTAEFTLSSGTLLDGERLVAQSFTGSITGVGTGSVSGSFAVLSGETDVSEYYDITVVPGKLTIKPRAVSLTAGSAEKEFDGKPLTKDRFTLSSGSLVAGHTLSASVSGTQTEVGSSANKIDAKTVKVTDGGGKNVTGFYSVSLIDGTLTVKPAASLTELTITMKNAEKVYDGKALSSKDYTLTSGKLADGDKLVLGKVTGEQTDAGTGSVTAAFTVLHGDDDVTAKYKITVVPGKLTVKARPITITAGSASKIYDGRALTSGSYKISSGELVKGHKLTASVSGSQTEIGSSANVVVKSTIKISDADGRDVTANYDITTAAGTLSVSRDPVTAITLTVGDGSKVYDGKPYRFLAADIRLTSGSLPSGYRIEATFNPEAPVDVGKYDVTIKSVTIRNSSGADVTSQFNISRVKGTFTITARPLTIETKAANKSYDGTALTERSTPNITGRAEGHQVTLRITGTQTKVGSSENTVADVKITDKESGADVTKNYAISYQYGLLTVSEAAGTDAGESGSYNWVNGSAGTLYVHFEHGYDGFEGLQVDGKDIDRSAYTSASGSTDIWLKASYLNTLSPGEHKLTAHYSGGEKADTSFSVSGTQKTTRAEKSSALWLWLAIMAAALVAAFAVAWYLFLGKDRRWKKMR